MRPKIEAKFHTFWHYVKLVTDMGIGSRVSKRSINQSINQSISQSQPANIGLRLSSGDLTKYECEIPNRVKWTSNVRIWRWMCVTCFAWRHALNESISVNVPVILVRAVLNANDLLKSFCVSYNSAEVVDSSGQQSEVAYGQSVTLNNVESCNCNGHYFALSHRIQ